MVKKLLKIAFWPKNGFLNGFLAITVKFFNIYQNGFMFDHQWLKALLLMHNTTIF